MGDLNATFQALGNETRRDILIRLAEGEQALSDLAAPFAMSQTAVSKHVGILARAGLVEVEKQGRVRRCRLRPDGFQRATEWLDDYRGFWTRGLENLAAHFGKKSQ